MLHKTLIALAAAVALGCLPMATTALAAHASWWHTQWLATPVADMLPDPAAVMLPDPAAVDTAAATSMGRSTTAAPATATARAMATVDALAMAFPLSAV